MATRRDIAVRDYRELHVWQKSHLLTLESYRVTKGFTREELFGLTSQLRRAASSVPANLAEGCGRGGQDLIRSSRIALGSAMELDYHFLLAHDLKLVDLDNYKQLSSAVVEVRRMLATFIARLEDGQA